MPPGGGGARRLLALGSSYQARRAPRLAAGAVHGERDAAGGLHEEAVEHSAVLAVVVEAIAQPLVLGGELGVGAPHDALVQVGDAQLVVLGVELEERGVEAPTKTNRARGVATGSSGLSCRNRP